MTFRTKTYLAIVILIAGMTAAYLNRKPERATAALPVFGPATMVLRDQTPPHSVASNGGSAWPGPIELSGPATPPPMRKPISLAPVAPRVEMAAPPVVSPMEPALAPIQPKIAIEYQPEVSQPSAVGYLRHRVREGETLTSIAQQYLGAADRYRDIFEANRAVLQSPNRVRVGMELVIPMRGDEPATLPAAQAQLISAPQRVATPAFESPAPQENIWRASSPEHRGLRTYLVRGDDTLGSIARQFYGDPREAQRLFDANREQLRTPDDLHAGMTIVIPQ